MPQSWLKKRDFTEHFDTGDTRVFVCCEYSPFGEVIRATGPMAKTNPFRFYTKYQDDESDLLYYGYRYYNAIMGKWLSRDPMDESQEEPNMYAFVLNDPTSQIDEFGLWHWKGGARQGNERATMLPDAYDITGTAANFTHLDSAETAHWLRDSTGHWLSPGEKINGCLEYDSPNNFVIGVGFGGFATTFLATWQNRVTDALEKRGFYVTPYRSDAGAKSKDITSAASGRDVWGLALFGHGFKQIKGWLDWSADLEFAEINGGLAWSGKEDIITPSALSSNHKFGLMVAYFCYADKQPWSSLVSSNGKYYGSHGAISVVSGPRAVGYWGSWDGLVGSGTE